MAAQTAAKPHFLRAVPAALQGKVLYKAEWLELRKVDYTLARVNGDTYSTSSHDHEVVQRLTRVADADGIDIIALTNTQSQREKIDAPDPRGIVLVLQYRPAVDRVWVGVPAGLVDAGETATRAAERELQEEAGVAGKIQEISPVFFHNASMTTDNARFAVLFVDGHAGAESGQPADAAELIEAIEVPMVALSRVLRIFGERGFAIDSKILALAYGYDLARA